MSARIPEPARLDVLAILCQLQADVRGLTSRVGELERGRTRGEQDAGARRLPLERAERRGLLPRSSRTIRGWMATPDGRKQWRTDLFVRRIGNRLEVDLDGLEKWRLAMSAPTLPEWPKRFGRRPQ